MEEERKAEPFYQARAQEFIDLLFEKDYFRKEVSREDMRSIEEYLAYLFQYQCESAKKCVLLVKQMREREVQ